MVRRFLSRPVLRAALLVAITVAAYRPALRGGFIWDDDAHVTNNSTLTSVAGLGRIWAEPGATPQYYPLVHSSFWIEHRLWGVSPFGYHLVNVLLHALAAVLLWRVLAALAVPGAWLGAALFALHPVHVESVAWITERKNVLSGVFYLAAALCLLRFYRVGDGARERDASRPRWGWYAAGSGLFLCALLSKTVTATLPLALLIVLWWKRDRLRLPELVPLVPLFVAGAALGLATVWLEKHHVGAEGAEWSLSFLQRCLLAGRVLWFYAGKLVWPARLSFVYPRWTIDPGVWWQLLFPLGTLGVVVTLARLRGRIGKGPLAAVLFFVATLFPALGFFNVFPMLFSWVADHFQYLASIGLIAAFAAGATTLARGLGSWGASVGSVAAGILLALLGSLTWRQCHLYQDAETLWRDTIAKNPGAWLAQDNLGVLLNARGEEVEAEARFRETLRLNPGYAPAHFALTHALLNQGKLAEAARLCREEEERWPTAQLTYENRSVLALLQGDTETAIRLLSETVRLFPDSVTAHLDLANLLSEQGRREEAGAQFAAVTRIVGPERASRLRFSLGETLAKQGKLEQAITEFSQALELDPGSREARANLALANQRLASAYFARGDAGRAETLLREALRVLPGNAEVHFALTRVVLEQGKLEEAAALCREEQAAWPTDQQTLENLGLVALQKGDAGEAERWFGETIRLHPDSATAHANLADILVRSGRRQEADEHYAALARIIGPEKAKQLAPSGSPRGSPAPR